MSEKVLLYTILNILQEKNVITKEDLLKIFSVENLVDFLYSKGLINKDEFLKNSKNVSFMVSRVAKVLKKKDFNIDEYLEIEKKYSREYPGVFLFLRKALKLNENKVPS